MPSFASDHYPRENPEAEEAIDDFLSSARLGKGPWDSQRRLLEQSPIYYSHRRNMWYVTGYNANEEILKSPSAQLQLDKRMDSIHPEWREHYSISKLTRWIAFLDGDAHKKVRLPLNTSFTPQKVEALRAGIRKKSQDLVASYIESGGGSFPDAVAYPIAESTLCEVFDFDISRIPDCRKLVNEMQLAFEIDVTPEQMEKADSASIEFHRFWHREYEDIAKNPEVVFGTDASEYSFHIEGLINFNNKPHYKIYFSTISQVEEILFRGTIYLEYESLSFARMEFNMNVEDRKDAANIFIRKKPSKMRVEVEKAQYIIDYIENNGKWYFNYSATDVEFKVRWTNRFFGLFSTNYVISSEIAITDRYNDNVIKFPRNERIRSTDVIAEKVEYFLDPTFWGEYNVIEPDQEITDAIQRLSDKLRRRNE